MNASNQIKKLELETREGKKYIKIATKDFGVKTYLVN